MLPAHPDRQPNAMPATLLERDAEAPGRLQITRQVAAHELCVISGKCRTPVQLAKGIVYGEIKRRGADQSSQPGHRLLSSPLPPVEGFPCVLQNSLLKFVPEFNRMPLLRKTCPQSSQRNAELLQRLVSFFIRRLARPDPLDAERRFAPSLRCTSTSITDLDANPRTGHVCQALSAKFQRHARLHRQKIKRCADNPYVGCLRHGPRLGAASRERTSFSNTSDCS